MQCLVKEKFREEIKPGTAPQGGGGPPEPCPVVSLNEEEFYKIVGIKINNLRILNGYSLSGLARRIGITPSCLSNYESGIRKIPLYLFMKIDEILTIGE